MILTDIFFVQIDVESFVKIFIHNYIEYIERIYNFYANRMIDGLEERIKINLINSWSEDDIYDSIKK